MQINHIIDREVRIVAIRIKREVKERRDQLLAERICLVCEEPIQGPVRRGECGACRKKIERLIDAGEITENDAIRDGLMTELPPKKSDELSRTAIEKRSAAIERLLSRRKRSAARS